MSVQRPTSSNQQDLILQLRFDFNNKNCRFEKDGAAGAGRSRIWRAMDQFTWPTHDHDPDSRDWGQPLPTSGADSLTLKGLRQEDSVYVIVTAANLPQCHTVRLVAIVSRKDKSKAMTLEGSPFYWNGSDQGQEQCFFDSGAHAGAAGTLDSQQVTLWWVGCHRSADLKVHTNENESLQLTVAAQVINAMTGKAVRDYGFDPEMDVGGGD